jgi:hypothetical protein
MALMVRKVMENRRRQHTIVTAHKRRIRDEVIPKLRATKREWYDTSRRNKLSIQGRWNSQKAEVQGQQRCQQIKHKNAISAHKRRIKAELAKRR